ncbi:MAG: hypothetical protein ABFD76_02440 [Smithella sp.]
MSDDERTPEQKKQDWKEQLGTKLRGEFTKNESNRRQKEVEWLQDLRQIRGLYDPDVHIETGRSQVYPKITRAKITSVRSRLNSMLFPTTDRNYTIEPTADPEIAQEIVDGLGQKVIQELQLEMQKQAQQTPGWTGGLPAPDPQEVSNRLRERVKQYAKNSSDLMQSEIDDQLLEMKYVDEAKEVLNSAIKFGTGVIRGPMVKTVNQKEYHFIDGHFKPKTIEVKYPYFKFTRIWDWYPDMSVTEPSKTNGWFERHVMSKLQMQELAKRSDFDGKMIEDYLESIPKGDCQMKTFEQELQDIDTQNKRDSGTARTISDNYELLEFWGIIEDENKNLYEGEAWLLGTKIIKERKNNIVDGKRPHRVFYYEKDETSIFGQGLPRIIRHSALAVGGASRAALDNASVVSGPQVEVNTSLLIAGQDIDGFYPCKLWYRKGYGIEAQYPALRNLSFDSHVSELLTLKDHFMNFADVESCLPAWVTSEPQKNTNEAVGATSIKVGNVLVSLEDIVKNFDAFTTENMRAIYLWNMEFNDRPEIKGDHVIKARGSSNLITKEVMMQSLNLLSTTLTPEEKCYVPTREFLKAKWSAHGMDVAMLRTDDEAKPFIQMLSDPEMQQLTKDQIRAEIDYKKSMTLKATAQAKDKNADASTKKPNADAANNLTNATAVEKHAKTADIIHSKQMGGEEDAGIQE